MKIKYLVMDVDGTLTDGKIYMSQAGELCKAFDIKDGYGISNILPKAGIEPVIMTGRSSDTVLNRCRELGVHRVYQGVEDKYQQLLQISENLSEIAYIGDDCNDLPCMQPIKDAGGLIGCPSDAVKQVKEIADYISDHKGGEGAVRNFIEWIVEQYSLRD